MHLIDYTVTCCCCGATRTLSSNRTPYASVAVLWEIIQEWARHGWSMNVDMETRTVEVYCSAACETAGGEGDTVYGFNPNYYRNTPTRAGLRAPDWQSRHPDRVAKAMADRAILLGAFDPHALLPNDVDADSDPGHAILALLSARSQEDREGTSGGRLWRLRADALRERLQDIPDAELARLCRAVPRRAGDAGARFLRSAIAGRRLPSPAEAAALAPADREALRWALMIADGAGRLAPEVTPALAAAVQVALAAHRPAAPAHDHAQEDAQPGD